MSLIFKPKIADSFKSDAPVVSKVKKAFHFASGKSAPKVKTVHRELVHWTTKELNRLVALKALGLTYAAIAPIIGRSANSCGTAISSNNLHSKYKKRREELINEVLRDD